MSMVNACRAENAAWVFESGSGRTRLQNCEGPVSFSALTRAGTTKEPRPKFITVSTMQLLDADFCHRPLVPHTGKTGPPV